MNLYLLSQSEQNGWDSYDGCVVAAQNKAEAVRIYPGEHYRWDNKLNSWAYTDCATVEYRSSSWANVLGNINVKLIGSATPGTKAGVILASFNAG